jgi:caffeoyl-CoA O-methyltransferase
LSNTFDFTFIDADKINYDNYYELCLKLLRPGGLIAIDNVLWSGDVVDERINDIDTESIRSLNKKLHIDSRVDISIVPIGDGLTLALKK